MATGATNQKVECRFCKRDLHFPCRSTREMEERERDTICQEALMAAGGGEYTVNRIKAQQYNATDTPPLPPPFEAARMKEPVDRKRR